MEQNVNYVYEDEMEIDLRNNLREAGLQETEDQLSLLRRSQSKLITRYKKMPPGTVPDSINVIILVRLLSPDRASSAMQHKQPRQSL